MGNQLHYSITSVQQRTNYVHVIEVMTEKHFSCILKVYGFLGLHKTQHFSTGVMNVTWVLCVNANAKKPLVSPKSLKIGWDANV